MAYSHTHNNEIFLAFFFWVFITLIISIILGVWLHEKEGGGECCSFEAGSAKKFPDDNYEYTVYLVIFGFILNSSILVIYCSARALVCHYYPEARYIPPSFYPDIVAEATAWESDTGGEVAPK